MVADELSLMAPEAVEAVFRVSVVVLAAAAALLFYRLSELERWARDHDER